MCGESRILLPEIRPLSQWGVLLFIEDNLEGRTMGSSSPDIGLRQHIP